MLINSTTILMQLAANQLKEGEFLYPGETRALLVTFFNVKGLREILTVGRAWRIQEGGQLVGHGIVKRIVSCS